MLIRIKNTIIRMRCYFFGHKKLDRLIIAYSIDAGYMYATIRIYKVSKCTRCGKIFHIGMGVSKTICAIDKSSFRHLRCIYHAEWCKGSIWES